MDLAAQRAEIEQAFQQSFPRPAPPKDFNPNSASNSDLIKYGYFPRPPDTAPQKLKELWEHVTSLPFQIVDPKIAVMATPFVDEAFTVRRNEDTPAWVGAIIPSPPSGEAFFHIGADWNVPSVGPPWWFPPVGVAGNVTIRYSIEAWVGWQSPQPDDAEPAWGPALNSGATIGTSSSCTVTNGEFVGQETKVWIQWRETISVVNGLSVYPGDNV